MPVRQRHDPTLPETTLFVTQTTVNLCNGHCTYSNLVALLNHGSDPGTGIPEILYVVNKGVCV